MSITSFFLLYAEDTRNKYLKIHIVFVVSLLYL
jgi:hypothetical protein